MTPEESNYVSDLRMKVIANINSGLPAHTGLDRESLKKAIQICRKDYTAAQQKSKASGVSNPSSGPAPSIDLAALFTTKANTKS